MNEVIYRVPGFLSKLSSDYLDGLEAAGWPADAVEHLKLDLPRFESGSLDHSLEECFEGLVYQHDDSHLPFFNKLHTHIRRTDAFMRSEDLRRKAAGNGNGALEAHRMIDERHGVTGSGDGKGGVNFTVNVIDKKKETESSGD